MSFDNKNNVQVRNSRKNKKDNKVKLIRESMCKDDKLVPCFLCK